MQVLVFFSLFVAVLAVMFAVQNTAPATVSFLFWHFEGSLALILLLAMSAGALISLLASLPTLVRYRLTIRGQKKRLAELGISLDDHKVKLEEAQKELRGKTAVNPPEAQPPPQTPSPSDSKK